MTGGAGHSLKDPTYLIGRDYGGISPESKS